MIAEANLSSIQGHSEEDKDGGGGGVVSHLPSLADIC
jgi:hypothetical protein